MEQSANPAARVGHYTRTISTSTQNASIWSLTAAASSDSVFRVLCTNSLTYLLNKQHHINNFRSYHLLLDASVGQITKTIMRTTSQIPVVITTITRNIWLFCTGRDSTFYIVLLCNVDRKLHQTLIYLIFTAVCYLCSQRKTSNLTLVIHNSIKTKIPYNHEVSTSHA